MSCDSSFSEEKERLFSLGNFSKKHCILFIIHPFCHVLYEFFLMKYEGEMTIKYFSNYFGNILINVIMLIICQKKCFLTYGKKKLKLYNPININKQSELYYEIIPYKSNIDSKTRYILFIIFSIIDFLIIICSNSYCGFENYAPTLGILLNWLLSYLFLSLSFENHHIFSMDMIFIGFLIISIYYSRNKNTFTLKNYLNSSFLLIQIYLEQLKKIIAYYILYKNEINVYFFLLINGVIGIVFGLIVSAIDHFFNKSLFLLEINIFKFIVHLKEDRESKGDCLFHLSFFLLLSIISGFKNLTECLIYKFFCPWFFGVSLVIIQFIFHVKSFKLNELPILFLLIILIFVCLIFNEQIICNNNNNFSISLNIFKLIIDGLSKITNKCNDF
jgi:hypothetical protein